MLLLLFFQAVLSGLGAVSGVGVVLDEKTGISTLFTPRARGLPLWQPAAVPNFRSAHLVVECINYCAQSPSIMKRSLRAQKRTRYTTQGDAFQHQPGSLMTTPNKASDTARECARVIYLSSPLSLAHNRVAITGHGNKKLAARKN